jgi:hypothetical protein
MEPDADLGEIDDGDDVPHTFAEVVGEATDEGASTALVIGVANTGIGVAKAPRASPAITWSWSRTKKLLELLTTDDDTVFDAAEGARWATFGDLRRKPPAGGQKYMMYMLYKHWCVNDRSMEISAEHPIMSKPDPTGAIGEIFVTRLSQTVKVKWELATAEKTGQGGRAMGSAAAEELLKEQGIYALCELYFVAGASGRKKRKEAPDRSVDSGAAGARPSGLVTQVPMHMHTSEPVSQ